MRAAVKNETDYTLSGGVSHNKMLAKLASAQNKPNKQTIVPSSGIPLLMKTLPLRSIRGLGGKFGAEVVRAVMADPSVSGKDEAGLLACDLHSIDQGTLSRHFGGFHCAEACSFPVQFHVLVCMCARVYVRKRERECVYCLCVLFTCLFPHLFARFLHAYPSSPSKR